MSKTQQKYNVTIQNILVPDRDKKSSTEEQLYRPKM